MGTPGLIARETGEGRYHHWDGYPSGLGRTLWTLYHGHFERDLSRMLRVLIDEHPAGWSTIVDTDFQLTPGFERSPAPACYCHGARSDSPQLLTLEKAARSGIRYAYILSDSHMEILKSYIPSDRKGNPADWWKRLAVIDFAEPEPNWRLIF